jgi:acyl dehydratase
VNDQLLYLEDLRVGDTFRTERHRLDASQVRFFAMHFDPQPFHLDEVAARQSLFGGLAASGWHTAATTMRLLVTSGPPLAGGIVGAGAKVEWKAPTRPGDELRVESEVIEIVPSRSKPDRGRVVLRSDTFNQRDEVVQTMVATLMVRTRSAQGVGSAPTETGAPVAGV